DTARAAPHRAARFSRQRLLRGLAVRRRRRRPDEAAPRLLAPAQVARLRSSRASRRGGGARRGLVQVRAVAREPLGAGRADHSGRGSGSRSGPAALFAVSGRQGPQPARVRAWLAARDLSVEPGRATISGSPTACTRVSEQVAQARRVWLVAYCAIHSSDVRFSSIPPPTAKAARRLPALRSRPREPAFSCPPA